jgi:hypothetical protein
MNPFRPGGARTPILNPKPWQNLRRSMPHGTLAVGPGRAYLHCPQGHPLRRGDTFTDYIGREWRVTEAFETGVYAVPV